MRNIWWTCAVTCAALCCCSTHRKNQDSLLNGIHICTSAARYAGTFQEFNRIISILFEISQHQLTFIDNNTYPLTVLHICRILKLWRLSVQRYSTAHFGVFMEHLERIFLCTGTVLGLTLECFWNILEGYFRAQAHYSGSLRGVSGTSWKDI